MTCDRVWTHHDKEVEKLGHHGTEIGLCDSLSGSILLSHKSAWLFGDT
jgi:hypothetical protein